MKLEQLLEGRDLVVLDLETTGTSTKADRVVQFAGVKIFADGRERDRLVSLVNPQTPIPLAATKVHKITDEMVTGAPTFCELEPELSVFLEGCDLGGYNLLAFDLPMLRVEYGRCGLELEMKGRRVIDGMLIFKHFERRDLGSALRFYTGAEHDTAHDALGDVEATIEVMQAQLDRYEDIPRDMVGLAKLSFGRRITPDGRVVWQDGMPCLGFGTHAGVPLQVMVRQQRSYLDWILGSDFSDDVKDVIRQAFAGKFPIKD